MAAPCGPEEARPFSSTARRALPVACASVGLEPSRYCAALAAALRTSSGAPEMRASVCPAIRSRPASESASNAVRPARRPRQLSCPARPAAGGTMPPARPATVWTAVPPPACFAASAPAFAAMEPEICERGAELRILPTCGAALATAGAAPSPTEAMAPAPPRMTADASFSLSLSAFGRPIQSATGAKGLRNSSPRPPSAQLAALTKGFTNMPAISPTPSSTSRVPTPREWAADFSSPRGLSGVMAPPVFSGSQPFSPR